MNNIVICRKKVITKEAQPFKNKTRIQIDRDPQNNNSVLKMKEKLTASKQKNLTSNDFDLDAGCLILSSTINQPKIFKIIKSSPLSRRAITQILPSPLLFCGFSSQKSNGLRIYPFFIGFSIF